MCVICSCINNYYKDKKYFINIIEIIDNINFDSLEKSNFLKNRFLKEVEFYDIRSSIFKCWSNFFRFFITIGTILISCLLPIQHSGQTLSFNNNDFSNIIYWIVWFISLLVSIFNGIHQLYHLDSLYISNENVKEILISEGWKYISLSDKYSSYSNHNDAFKPFCEEFEYIKINQVNKDLKIEMSNIKENILKKKENIIINNDDNLKNNINNIDDINI